MARQRPTRTIEVELHGVTRSFTLYDTELSLIVATECLSGAPYPTPPQVKTRDVKTIVDVGANIGAASIWFHSRFPNAQIHAFEPCEQSFNLLVQNTLDCNVRRYHAGLSNLAGSAPLFHGEQDAACDSIRQPRDYFPTTNVAEHAETVAILKTSDALNKLLPIDILKIDTEGSEIPILQSLRRLNYSENDNQPPHYPLEDIAVIHVEYHSEKDRLEIQKIVGQTHTLFHASTTQPHRGLLGYLRNDLLTKDDDNREIT